MDKVQKKANPKTKPTEEKKTQKALKYGGKQIWLPKLMLQKWKKKKNSRAKNLPKNEYERTTSIGSFLKKKNKHYGSKRPDKKRINTVGFKKQMNNTGAKCVFT